MYLLELNLEIRDAIAAAVVALLGLIVKWIAKKFELAQAKADALAALATAVAYVQQTYADEIKKASEDGVLTDEEKAKARRTALSTAISIAPDNAAKIIKAWTEDQARVHIEAEVARQKA